MPTPEPIQLEYGAAPPPWRKRTRRIILALILLTAGFCSWKWGPYAWHQSKILYWQRQCLNFSLPADTVVYEEDPVAAASLLKNPNYSPYVLKRGDLLNHPPTTVQAAAFDPRCWGSLNSCITIPSALAIASGSGANIFLHERTSPAGHRRLVCLRYAPDSPTFVQSFIGGYNCDTCVITPANWKSPPVPAMRLYAIDVISGFPRHPPLVRVYAGQIDPNDPAHFTIRYQMWGQEDVLDGRLQDDDQVTLIQRHMPEMPRN